MSQAEAFIAEWEQESGATKAALEAIPEDKFSWKPHEKSLSLGQLGQHIAQTPLGFAKFIHEDGLDFDQADFEFNAPATKVELLGTFETSLAAVRESIGKLSDEDMDKPWAFRKGEVELMKMTKGQVIRMVILNHTYHHRGQLGVYLRLLDVPVPVVYGNSADNNPMAAQS